MKIADAKAQIVLLEASVDRLKAAYAAAVYEKDKLEDQLKAGEVTECALTQTMETLKKELEGARNSYSYHSKQAEKANQELEAVHTILDNLPCAIPRRDETAAYGQQDKSILVRFCVYLAMQNK